MLRFLKPNGKAFRPGYMGAIHVFDSGNDLIAICRGSEIVDLDDEEPIEICGDPNKWEDWEIVIALPEKEMDLLARAIATAYTANEVVDHILLPEKSKS